MNGMAWCPTCKEWTVIEAGRPCAWCDTIIVTRRGGWKRTDRHARSRISRGQALVLHRAHENGKSLREISRVVADGLGYSSANSCLEGIRAAFDREGLNARTQPEATSMANLERPTKRLPGESRNEYKRRVRREHGYRDTRTGEWRVAA